MGARSEEGEAGESRVECLFRHGAVECGRSGPEYRGYAAELTL